MEYTIRFSALNRSIYCLERRSNGTLGHCVSRLKKRKLKIGDIFKNFSTTRGATGKMDRSIKFSASIRLIIPWKEGGTVH
jgi:hypothetical protein